MPVIGLFQRLHCFLFSTHQCACLGQHDSVVPSLQVVLLLLGIQAIHQTAPTGSCIASSRRRNDVTEYWIVHDFRGLLAFQQKCRVILPIETNEHQV